MGFVSIVIPVYYNATSLPELADRLSALADAEHSHDFEFIYVDDGSGDNSYDVLCQLAKRDSRIRLVKLSRNFGSNTAIIAGIAHASGNCVAFIAADLQDPPEKLHEMIRKWESGYKVVLAIRKDRKGDPWLTRFFANVSNWLINKLLFRGFSPQGIGFFLIDQQVAKIIIQSGEKNAFLPGLILWTGFQPSLVLYDRQERVHGKSRWTFQKKLKFLIDAFAAFSYVPLRLCSLLGLIFASLGGLYAVVIIISRLLNIVPIQGWSALMVVVLVATGLQLIMLGVIGEYLWRTFDAARHRPLYIVDKLLNFKDEVLDINDHEMQTPILKDLVIK
jgi:glycosyltransferase involved in cell wall biosynthesis